MEPASRTSPGDQSARAKEISQACRENLFPRPGRCSSTFHSNAPRLEHTASQELSTQSARLCPEQAAFEYISHIILTFCRRSTFRGNKRREWRFRKADTRTRREAGKLPTPSRKRQNSEARVASS